MRSIKNLNGDWCFSTDHIASAFVDYYKLLLGQEELMRSNVKPEIVARGPLLSLEDGKLLCKEVSGDEIKNALFSIQGIKAPGPDGFNSTFYKEAWEDIGGDIIEAVKDFFVTSKLLKELNCTSITLVPKVKCPDSVTDFRPISCCNVLYKCITKVLAARLNLILPQIISQNQAGFIKGRQIFHNIGIIQDIVALYTRKSSPLDVSSRWTLEKLMIL